MVLIVGKEYCKVDANGRIRFPIALKRQLEGEECRFVIRESIANRCLELWTDTGFKEEMEFLHSRLRIYDPEERELLDRLSAGNTVELDGSDRLLIPPEQKHVVDGAKEVVLQGTGRFIEIWDRKTYDEVKRPNRDYAEMAKRLLYR